MLTRIPSVPPIRNTVLSLAVCLTVLGGAAAVAYAAGPQQIATYPRDGDQFVPSNATLYFVFDQPTNKTGGFIVADLDSGSMGGVQLNLDSPRWSALGDTVFLKPLVPMTSGHRHGMIVNTIYSADGTEASNDLPTVYFTVRNISQLLSLESIVLEEPLPGTVVAAGDTLRARAVVTGRGTGAFRVLFTMDGEPVATEEGFMEAGRPVTIEPRGPLLTRRFGEHRLHAIVESPQALAARPITFLCVPPAAGVTAPPRPFGSVPFESEGSDSGGAAGDTTALGTPAPPAAPAARRLTMNATVLGLGKSQHREEEGSAIGWSDVRARYALSDKTSLEGDGLWRLRGDDLENGSGIPERFLLRLGLTGGAAEWGDLTPALSSDAPLFASAVPRRGAQATWNRTPAGNLEAFVALESRPRSAAGSIDQPRSDLYAARLTHAFAGERIQASAFGGYTHDEPTAGAADSVVRANGVYGGSGRFLFASKWKLSADLATVRHRAIEGVEPGRSRTGVRGLLQGELAGFVARAEAFRYQPDLATTLNPYALSNREGWEAAVSRDITGWQFFGGYRREDPDDPDAGQGPPARLTRWTAGGRLKLNQASWVTPAFIRIDQKGATIDLREQRAATELVIGEKDGGQTRGRFDIALYEDKLSEVHRHRITSGSLVMTRRHPGRVTSSVSGGFEISEFPDIDLTDQTIQAALEIRWEAVAGKLLLAPFVTWLDRDEHSVAREEERLSGRFQVSWIEIPGLSRSALSLEGRIDQVRLKRPVEDESVEVSVQLSFAEKFDVLK